MSKGAQRLATAPIRNLNLESAIRVISSVLKTTDASWNFVSHASVCQYSRVLILRRHRCSPNTGRSESLAAQSTYFATQSTCALRGRNTSIADRICRQLDQPSWSDTCLSPWQVSRGDPYMMTSSCLHLHVSVLIKVLNRSRFTPNPSWPARHMALSSGDSRRQPNNPPRISSHPPPSHCRAT